MVARRLLFVGLLMLAGCTRVEEYVEVARDQQQAWKDVTAVLARVKTEEDLAGAKAELDEHFDRCAVIARRANALPKPPPPEAQTKLEGEAYLMERTFKQLAAEVSRVKMLPGGEQFFKQYAGQGGLPGWAD